MFKYLIVSVDLEERFIKLMTYFFDVNPLYQLDSVTVTLRLFAGFLVSRNTGYAIIHKTNSVNLLLYF